jgi:hypothetical protein
VSVLGEFVRLDPQLLEDVRRDPDAYQRLIDFDPAAHLDLDRAWARLALLLDEAGFLLNPIRAGDLFPDGSSAWGYAGDSRALSVDQVRQAAIYLNATPFGDLAAHVPAVALALGYVGPFTPERLQGLEKYVKNLETLPSAGPAVGTRTVIAAGGVFGDAADAELTNLRDSLERWYVNLVEFFRAAAAAGQCTVFWAA